MTSSPDTRSAHRITSYNVCYTKLLRSSVATTFDGYPMAQQGHATHALTLAFMSAGTGAMFGVVVITVLSGWVTEFASYNFV